LVLYSVKGHSWTELGHSLDWARSLRFDCNVTLYSNVPCEQTDVFCPKIPGSMLCDQDPQLVFGKETEA
jgi:hypothetical protein